LCTPISSSNFAATSNKEDQVQPRVSKRARKVKDFDNDFYIFLLVNDPKSYGEAMISVDASFWKKAIKDEMDSLKANKI